MKHQAGDLRLRVQPPKQKCRDFDEPDRVKAFHERLGRAVKERYQRASQAHLASVEEMRKHFT